MEPMSTESEVPNDGLNPPSAERVAARALVITAVTCRGFVEADAQQAQEFWSNVLQWFNALGLDAETEPWERAALDTPLGSLEKQIQINAQWLCEGLVVLAWALKRCKLPAHDVQVVAAEVGNSLGFLLPGDETVLAGPEIRASEEIASLQDSLFSVHWRLREYSLRPEKLDFNDVSRKAWFGPLPLKDVRLLAGDLAIGNQPIWQAPSEAVRVTSSIAQERHRAINWLAGECDIYSETETNT